MYPISMRGFAEVCAAPENRKAAKLKKYKFSKSEESKARSNYYVKALTAIRHHHRGNAAKVTQILKELTALVDTESDSRKRAKAANNLRALGDYMRHYGRRVLTLTKGTRLYYHYKDLLVSAQPDLVAEENGQSILIKLNLGSEDFTGGVAGYILHVLHEAARLRGLRVTVECLQVSTGSRIVGPRSGFGPISNLERRADEVLSLWPTVS
jgi:hypothetical protein